MTFMKLNSINNTINRVEYDFNVSDDLKRYFNLDEPFFIEYSEDITKIPKKYFSYTFFM